LIILIIYILSPLDLHPLFLDDLIASGILFYLLYKNAKQKRQRDYFYSYTRSKESKKNETDIHLDLEEAYKVLGLNPNASWEEVKRAYKEKIAKSHPDKVSHLSEELQEKAKELTLKLNKALDIIKRNKM
jgi:DnaJ-domain-containing protein 1